MNPYRIILWLLYAAIVMAFTLRFGAWNVCAMYGIGSLVFDVCRGLYKLLEVAETPSTRRFY